MRGISNWVWTVLDRNLGRCPKCMRQAFLAALFSWIAVAATGVAVDETIVTVALAAVALGLSALWLAHLATYAARVTARGGAAPAAGKGDGLSRRELIPVFARTLGGIALATAMPAAAFGEGTCDCSKCNSDQYCCPTANGYCGCFPMPCP